MQWWIKAKGVNVIDKGSGIYYSVNHPEALHQNWKTNTKVDSDDWERKHKAERLEYAKSLDGGKLSEKFNEN